MRQARIVFSLAALMLSAGLAHAAVIAVGSVTQTDNIDWVDFQNQVLSGGLGSLTSTFNTVTVGGIKLTVSQAGQSFPNNDFHATSGFADAGINLENFVSGSTVNPNPIVLDFGLNPATWHAIGFFVGVNAAANTSYSVAVHVLGAGNVELTGSPLTFNSSGTGPIFVGIQSDAVDIQKLSIFPTFNSGAAQHNWAIGSVILDSRAAPSSVPEPSTLALTLAGAAAALAARKLRRN